MPAASDQKILDQFANTRTREAAFRDLMNTYQERLYWHIRRMVYDHEDANDVLQNTFIKAWKALANFKENSKLYTWLYRIATNEALTFLQQRNKHQTVPMEQGGEYDLAETMNADPYFDGDETERKLQAAIQALPDKQRAVFNMRYYDEMPYQEMSEIMETSVGALKASFHHAVKKIEEKLRND